jgi:phosphotransferase system  glucose/maltose/N-acetylglucosamine-specific IIC component
MPLDLIFAIAALAVVAVVLGLLIVQRQAMAAVVLKIDGRGWLAIGNWLLVLAVLVLLAFAPELRKDDLFKMIAQALVMSGFINLVLAFYFTASKPPASADAGGSLRPSAPPLDPNAPPPPPAKDD